MSMYNHILYQARLHPKKSAINFGAGHISYSKLVSLIASVASKMAQSGIREDIKVAIQSKGEILEELVFGLALSALGAQWISNAALATGKIKPSINLSRDSDTCEGHLRIDDTWYTTPPLDTFADHSKKIWYVTSTSGATGTPKIIGLTNKIVIDRLKCHPYAYGLDVINRSAGALFSLNFPFGIMSALSPLLRGGNLILNSGSMQDPNSNLNSIQHLTASPQMLSMIIRDRQSFMDQFSSLQSIMLSGSRVENNLIKRLREISQVDLYTSYGASEIGPVANIKISDKGYTNDIAGYVYPWVHLEIVDESGNKLSAEQEGLVRIKTPYMLENYLDDIEVSHNSFMDGWFYPGDIGSLSKEGLLHINGRQDNLINIGGYKINPEAIESFIHSMSDIRDVAIISMPTDDGVNEVWAAVVTPVFDSDFSELHKKCVEKFGIASSPKKIIHVTSIPRTETGKIDRQRLATILIQK